MIAQLLAYTTICTLLATHTQRSPWTCLVNALLALYYPHHWRALLLATLHSLVQPHLPFIDAYTRVAMHVHVMIVSWPLLEDSTKLMMAVVLLGVTYHAWVNLWVGVDDDEYRMSAVFSAVGSGVWMSIIWIEHRDYAEALSNAVALNVLAWALNVCVACSDVPVWCLIFL